MGVWLLRIYSDTGVQQGYGSAVESRSSAPRLHARDDVWLASIEETPSANGAADENDAGAVLFEQTLDKDVTRLKELVHTLVKFLECTERELPHGCQPAETRSIDLASDKDHYLTVGGKINKNYAKHVMHKVRQEFQHEKRGRVANLAGWQMAGRRLIDRAGLKAKILADAKAKASDEGEGDYDEVKEMEDFIALGCRPPMVLHPLFYHGFDRPDADSGLREPQIICSDNNVRILMGFFAKTKIDKKVRLSPGIMLASGVKRLITALPSRTAGTVRYFDMTSQLRDIVLKPKTEILELHAHCEEIEDGLKVTLTEEAEEAFQEVCKITIDEKIAQLEKKMKVQASEKLKENVIKCSEIKFVADFVFNEHSFLAKPTTEKGMAMARSGMQHVALRRVQLLGLDPKDGELSEPILRILPLHFDREYFGKSKHNLETYSRQSFFRLRDMIIEFEKKHSDKLFKSELSKLQDIVKESALEP